MNLNTCGVYATEVLVSWASSSRPLISPQPYPTSRESRKGSRRKSLGKPSRKD